MFVNRQRFYWRSFHCWHAELPTETRTKMVNADSVDNRLLNALFHFLVILMLFCAHNRLFYKYRLVWVWLVILSMCFAYFSQSNIQCLYWKDAFSFICVSPGSAETYIQVKWENRQAFDSLSNVLPKIMQIRSCLLELQLKMSGSLIWDTA